MAVDSFTFTALNSADKFSNEQLIFGLTLPKSCDPLKGEIPDLFSDDEVENIVTMVRNEVKVEFGHPKALNWSPA